MAMSRVKSFVVCLIYYNLCPISLIYLLCKHSMYGGLQQVLVLTWDPFLKNMSNLKLILTMKRQSVEWFLSGIVKKFLETGTEF